MPSFGSFQLCAHQPIYALDSICHREHTLAMIWEIEFTDEFGTWWETLSDEEQESVRASVKLLGELGPSLRFPHTSGDQWIAARPHARASRPTCRPPIS